MADKYADHDAAEERDRDMEVERVIYAESIETLPAVRSTGMLLAGADTTAKLEHAMEIAKALSHVIEQQKLYANISGKKHVLVEGWELLGSLLGVFPVVEWTRQTSNGWEARVVAKTLDGAEVGSAEMMCTRDENRWKSADDYAIRSMAQTRAVSKSLRAPLGFVMKLAGYEPTPEAEIPVEPPVPPKAFDPETDLVEGAIKGKDAPKRIAEALNGLDSTVDWPQVISAISDTKYGSNWSELTGEDAGDFWRRLSNATFWMQEVSPAGEFPPITAELIAAQIARAFSGMVVEVHYREREKGVLTPKQQEQVDEALADENDDVKFGEEEKNDEAMASED